jgi:hypothetical protein
MPTAQSILEAARNNLITKDYRFPSDRINSIPHKTLMTFNKYSIAVDPDTLTTTPNNLTLQGLEKGGTPTVAITLPLPIKIHEPYTVAYETVNISAIVGKIIDSLGGQNAAWARSAAGNAAGPYIGYGINPYSVLKLKNVHLRRHELFFKLAPESKEDTDIVEKIISEIRLRMHPEMELLGLLLRYPELLNFRYLGPRNPDHVFPIGPCVIENFMVDRTAADYPTFFAGTGTPSVYGLYLTLKEILPLYRDNDKLSTVNYGATSYF